MNVLLVSQCSGRAIVETRRVLDQFAERRGEGTWQTPITKNGLDTLRKLLRKTARRNTAVACHWLKKNGRTELIWIVGNARRFNAVGAVPTDTTERDILRADDENTWHSLPVIKVLVGLAALFHDFGKANADFQKRLRTPRMERNLFRHEWISLCLFAAFVRDGNSDIEARDGGDEQWLKRLAAISADDEIWKAPMAADLSDKQALPFESLPPFARAVGWLMVSHHRLPKQGETDNKDKKLGTSLLKNMPDWIEAGWNEPLPAPFPGPKESAPYWTFAKGLPHQWESWRKRATHLAQEALRLPNNQRESCLTDPYIMHLSRLCLMLADHGFSSLPSKMTRKPVPALYANTKAGHTDQSLEEHLLGVERFGRSAARMLPRVAEELPRLAQHKLFRKRTAIKKFQWQDRAGDLAASVRVRSAQQGAFIVNMASTGCGKTLGNGRIMHNLADESKGMRCAFALGLRTLTLQTGREFRKLLGLGEDEVAIRVGGAASRKLFDHYQQKAEDCGSESSGSLMPDNSYVHFEGNPDALPGMHHLLDNPHARNLLLAPLLVCTIDHLVPATESLRGGHQLAPMLRLLSGDLVLDELDDYGIEDLHAVTRLVYWAGLSGSRVLVSSATLPPSLVEGMFMAYRQGRRIFQHNQGEATDRELPACCLRPVCCLWVDEFHCTGHDCSSEDFQAHHAAFVEKRRAQLQKAPVRRRGKIVRVETNGEDVRTAFAATIMQTAQSLHRNNASPDPHSNKRISFGLVRMANIGPLYDIAQKLFSLGTPEGVRIHLCVYHSQFPLLLRSAIEQRLDRVLNRKDPLAVFDQPDIRQTIDAHPEEDQLFIVLASPVAEVGRDHDYDWAVVEPSSMRSIIQLAGRIRRHRDEPWDKVNIALLHTNVKALEKPGETAFCRPGFESNAIDRKLKSHDLDQLLTVAEYETIDAQPRIVARENLAPRSSLVDLEHSSLQQLMHKVKKKDVGAYSCWDVPQSMLSGMLQWKYPFRQQTRKEVDVWLKPDEDGEDYTLHWVFSHRGQTQNVSDELRNHRLEDEVCTGVRVSPWGATDYMQALRELADELDMELETCARRFGLVTLPESTNGWWFHPLLGFNIFHD